MAINLQYPILTLERANTWAFTAPEEFTVNVLEVDPDEEIESPMTGESGLAKVLRRKIFRVKCVPFCAPESDTHQDRSDLLALMDFIGENKPLRIKDCTTAPYNEPCAARTMLINRHVTYTGEHSKSLNNEDGVDEFSFTLLSRLRE